MPRPSLVSRLTALAVGAAIVSVALPGTSNAGARMPPADRAVVRVGGDAAVPATSTDQGFLGIATELSTIPALAGPAADPDTPMRNLLRDLSPGAPFLLRLGGVSTDDSWWPGPGVTKPPYAYTLTPRWGAGVRSLLDAIGGRAIVGVALRDRSRPVAAAEVAGFDRFVGANLIDAFELGNEPEFYPWTQVSRGASTAAYDRRFAYYGKEFSTIAPALGGVPLAGPSSGSTHWLPRLGTVLSDMPPHLKLVTVHAYPLKNCSRLARLRVSDLLARSSIQGLADSVHATVGAAAAHGAPLRVDEINGVSCGGESGLSNSFAEALWALNVLPALWRAGVQGVNFQTIDLSGDLNRVIAARHTASGWRVSVEPEYYGLLAFADAAPAGSHLLRLSGSAPPGVDRFAVRAPDGTERVVLTNVGSAARTIAVTAAGTRGTGSLALLSARSLSAIGGVTLAGQRLSARTGQLSGPRRLTPVTPSARGVYAVRVPAHAAAILTIRG